MQRSAETAKKTAWHTKLKDKQTQGALLLLLILCSREHSFMRTKNLGGRLIAQLTPFLPITHVLPRVYNQFCCCSPLKEDHQLVGNVACSFTEYLFYSRRGSVVPKPNVPMASWGIETTEANVSNVTAMSRATDMNAQAEQSVPWIWSRPPTARLFSSNFC